MEESTFFLCAFPAGASACSVCGDYAPDPSFPRNCSGPRAPGSAVVAEPLPAHGPGTELKKLLALIGITAAPDCACNAHAAEMDAKGGEWCAANLDTIVGWLREQATARGLPFIDAAGKMLVKRAIRNAARLTQ